MYHSLPGRKVLLLVLSFALFLIGLALRYPLGAQPDRPRGIAADAPLIVRFYYNDLRDLLQFQSFDLWEYNNLQERYVLGSIDYANYQALLEQGRRVEIDHAATAAFARRESRFANLHGGYRGVEELYGEMQSMNAADPGLTELVDYGRSACLNLDGCLTPGGDALAGFPLRAMRVTNEAVPGASVVQGGAITRGDKPVFFLMAGIHAREITTPEIAMRFLEALLDGYGTDADATWLIDHHEIWVVPTANPDGHWLVELGEEPGYGGAPFYQRKNANLDADGDGDVDCGIWPPDISNQYGVDLNRNHSFGWGQAGSSGEPCNQTFRGPAAASETEVAQLEALIRALVPDQRGPSLNDPAPRDTTGIFITLHSFGELVLWPWGHIFADAPNRPDLKAIGDKFAAYNGYFSCPPSECLYLAGGASDDWAYGELGIPAFTFEVGKQFMPPYAEIAANQWPLNRPALLYAAKIARAPYLTVHGPDVSDIIVSGGPDTFEVRATIRDDRNGNQPITAAVYSVDTPPWAEGAIRVPLVAIDGAFDSPVESVAGQIAGLTEGQHTLFVQGRDDGGHWGAVSAAFFPTAGPDWTPTDFVFLPRVLR
jgi:hypothetical protein